MAKLARFVQFSVLPLLLATAATGRGGRSHPTASATPMDPPSFVMVEMGDLPVVISAPHGGTMALSGIPERVNGTKVLDTHTYELAQAVRAQLAILTGRKAYLVAARASRKFVDFNRSPSDAFENPAVAPVYAYYHDSLQTALAAAKAQSTAGALLVDLHAHGGAEDVIYRGTKNGATADLRTLYRQPRGLLAELLARNLKVFPDNSGGTENPALNGGYIVQTYGLSGTGLSRMNAVQLEFGAAYRSTRAEEAATAKALAEAIVAHLQAKGALPARLAWQHSLPGVPPLPQRVFFHPATLEP